MTVVHTTCCLCEAMCGLLADVDRDAGEVRSIKPDPDDPLSRGDVCPKAFALPELHADPDRLRAPMRKVGDGWEEVSWDAALDEAAARIHAVQEAHGRDVVGSYLGNPNVHNTGCVLFAPAFVRMLSRTRFSATSLDQLPHQFVAWQMFGHQLLLPITDVDRADFLLIVGANPVASGGSIMSSPDVRKRLRAIQKRGGRVVVVDPRRTETAKIAGEHHFVRPGTDAAWLAALLREVLEQGADVGRLAPHVRRLDVLKEAIAPFTPERAAHTGLSADTIRELATAILEAPSAAVYGRIGVSTHAFGATCQWLINAINLVTGNLDRPGGAMFTAPALDLLKAPRSLGLPPGSISRRTTRVRGRPAVMGEYPAATMAEEMDTPGEGRMRGLVTIAGNPVLSAPHGRRIEAALADLDVMIAIDPYLNETTRHADLILPPVSPLERSHYDLIFHALAVRNTAKYNPPLFEPPANARHDWQIIHGLETRLGRLRGDGVQARAERWVRGKLGPERIVDIGLRAGPRKLSLKALRETPSGVDFGPLTPALPDRLPAAHRWIDAAPELLVADLARLELDEAPGMRLIGRRNPRDCNSWLHNAPVLMRGKDRCTLMMHPDDAARIGAQEGGRVTIRSRVGEITAPVTITPDLMPGVVSLPHGYGHGRPGTRMSVASANPGVSINDLTDDQAIDPVSGNAAFTGVPVQIEAVVAAEAG